ncbi:uncharacterized protein DKFZp434B061 [Temnothorax curvispinosus]|uniref:Uncharacterized protein DKFZp434B061 n=1 Tax=Temnothorax curvispinosus TaxID=300111 RepID=A0A6J1PNK2_9HYME|nr:uncharacterized protein DKFZp434B061 [Temnothorax curvispinosus]
MPCNRSTSETKSAESVDTSDNTPPPALPPRRPLRACNAVVLRTRCEDAPQRPASTARTDNTAATATTTTTAPPTKTAATIVPTTLLSTSQGCTNPSAVVQVSPQPQPQPQPPLLTPPQYPAPPRPPSRTGGDEARVARARGSGRGALPSPILANGTPSSRVSPPRAGWAVRITEATLTPTSNQRPSVPDTPTTSVERWASERTAPVWTGRAAASLSAAAAATTTNTRGGSFSAADRGPASTAGIRLEHRRVEEREELEATKKVEHWQRQYCQDQQQRRHLETPTSQSPGAAGRLKLSDRPMSRNDAISPLTRSPSSRANIAAGDDCANGASEDADSRLVSTETRVHDHSRPFPPPRLPLVHVTSTSMPSVPPPPPPPPPSASQSVPGSPTPRVAPLTMPLTPLSSSFRSRPSLRRPQNAEMSPSDANSRGLLSLSSTDTTITTIATSPRSPIGEVSLATPRPDGERTINEYVEAPFNNSRCNQERRLDVDSKTAADCPKTERRHHHHHHHSHRRSHEDATMVPTHRARGRAKNQSIRGFSGTATGASPVATSTNVAATNVVTKQPVSFTKEPANTLGTRTYDPAGLSIICDFCGRCRCESCREPPPLPSKWLCDNTCLCSAETVLDYASCLCCVKGLFYHCVDGGNGGSVASTIDGQVAATSCADEPCSCTGNRTASRWACLGALALVMPCLLCYWPLRGCVTLCEACYARHAAQGCRCNTNAIGSRHHPITSDIGDSRDPEKRLLDPVTPEP